MSTERSGFYPKTVHVLFAVVLAISFQQASETMIPIQMVVEPEKIVPNIVLALSYLVVILGCGVRAFCVALAVQRHTVGIPAVRHRHPDTVRVLLPASGCA